ncbi:diacylglycerol kinase theta-like [Senna tora]|uniref:Diacylglycerol kinase theta-like n=1 Tax=Senna tora TaxID=362788 RepID=A0A834XKG5_9FABA|nr:diacylglycerol kinase theta-like [Senna tora]
MDSERKYIIEHVTHPGHPLSYVEGSRVFQCDGCNKTGNGSKYQCATCDFDLHEHCATCPSSFSFVVHPPHHLNLISHAHLSLQDHICDVCGTEIDGILFYRCERCNFDVHPLCTQLPETTRHPLHPDHLLRLQPLSVGVCRVCQTSGCGHAWGYGCHVCDFNIHLQCLNSPIPRGSTFLDTLMSPMAVLIVMILALLIFLILMSTKNQHNWKGYSVHSVYVHR